MCERMMPPDYVLIIMGIEEKFGFAIPDEDAEKVLNMGQLHEYVLSRVARGQPQVCISSATFYRVRRALACVWAVPREQVRPQTRLVDIIPLFDRRRAWHELQTRLSNVPLPPLRRPTWLARRIEALSILPLSLATLLYIALMVLLRDGPAAYLVAMFGVVGCLVVGIGGDFVVCRLACRSTEQYAVHFPPACTTVRDLVYAVIAQSRAAPMVSDTSRPTDKEVWGALCAIVGAEFDRAPTSFTKLSDFT
jgi:hypothetical protein